MDLVWVGSPLRPEFAAWRYARFFKRRRQKEMAWSAVGMAGGAALAVFGLGVIGLATSVVSAGRAVLPRPHEIGRADRFLKSHVTAATGHKVLRHDTVDIRIIPSEQPPGWGIRFAYHARFVDFSGAEALRTAQIVSPAVNVGGASDAKVQDALRALEAAATPDEYFKKVLRYGQGRGWKYTGLKEYPEEMRLAFEMASHEDSERRALDGELDRLERDWKEAEEIAAIADNLFLPKSITDWVDRHQTRLTGLCYAETGWSPVASMTPPSVSIV